MKPISFDYRISNLCNFKCRMCGEQLSSSWESEKRKYNEWDEKQEPWMVKGVREVIGNFQDTVVVQELREAIEDKRIREMYWVGGEPLMWNEHWELMDLMVANGVSQDVTLRYNTNLSRVDWRGKNLYTDYLAHFKSVNICASIDGTEKIGEFIRTGLNWDSWLANFEQGVAFKNQHGFGDDYMVMDLTLTLPGLFSLVDLVKEANRLDVKMYTKIMFAFDPSLVLSPFALPRDVLDRFLDDLILEIEPITNNKNQSVLNTLVEMKNRPTFEEQFPDTYRDGFINGRDYQRRLAERRNDAEHITIEEIYSSNEAVLRWWND